MNWEIREVYNRWMEELGTTFYPSRCPVNVWQGFDCSPPNHCRNLQSTSGFWNWGNAPEIWGLFLDKTKKGMGQVIRMPMEANGTTEA